MNKAKLKGCPFCGAPGAIKEGHESHFVVQCTNEQCKASVFPPEMSPLAALTVWNTRAGDSGLEFESTGQSGLLDLASRKFHAFEWLRKEAIKGNAHAEQLMQEVIWLRGIRGQAKKALKECNADADNSEAALLRQMCNASV